MIVGRIFNSLPKPCHFIVANLNRAAIRRQCSFLETLFVDTSSTASVEIDTDESRRPERMPVLSE